MGTVTIDLCPECCDPCAGLPDVFDAEVADIESCGCVGAILDTPTALNGSHTGITRVTGENYWRKELGTVGITLYSGEGCTGTSEADTTYWTLFIVCSGGTLVLLIIGRQGSYPATPTDPVLNGGFAATIPAYDTPTANGLDCSDGLSLAAGGTGEIIVP